MSAHRSGAEPASVAEELLRAEGLEASAWSNGPRDRYGAHRHTYDKVLVAVRGSIVFHLTELGRDVALATGDRLDLPCDTEHAATVGDGGVTCLEAHLPAGSLGDEPRHIPRWAHVGAVAGAAPTSGQENR